MVDGHGESEVWSAGLLLMLVAQLARALSFEKHRTTGWGIATPTLAPTPIRYVGTIHHV